MRWSGLRLSVTLLTVIPLRDPVTEPRRATVAAAMAWAPAVGLLLGVIAAAVLVVADRPLGAGPLTAPASRWPRSRSSPGDCTWTAWPTWLTAWAAASPHR